MVQEKYGTKWSEEETILAFYYYCLIPFGKIQIETTGKGQIRVTVPPAKSTDGMPVTLYRLTAKIPAGLTADRQWKLPRYYVAGGQEEYITFEVGGLPKGVSSVSVTAETAYGVKSESLDADVTLADGENIFAVLFRIILRPFRHIIDLIKNAV